MKYKEALKRWGKAKLEEVGCVSIILDLVHVQMIFNEGYACCGGRDESCYCSMAESPSANVMIRAGYSSREISAHDFDFVEILGEIVAIADGHVTD